MAGDLWYKGPVRVINQVLNIVCLILAALWTVPCTLACVIFFMIKWEWGRYFYQIWARGWCWLMSVHITAIGLEDLPRDAVILAPNHESMYDILVMGTFPLFYKWVSKEEMKKAPVLGWGIRAMGTYFVKRDHSGHDLNVMKEVEDGLRSGMSVIMFPEGTRTRTGELLPFKKGAFRTALNSGAPLVPIAITGTRSIAPPGRIPTGRNHRVIVRFGRPFYISPGTDLPRAMEDFRRELVCLLEQNRTV